MDRLGLTAAELAFLLSVATEPQRRQAEERLRMTELARTGTVTGDGLASLIVRGLAVAEGDRITLGPAAATVQHGLIHSTLWVAVGTLTSESADASQLYAYDRGMFLLAPRAQGTFVVQGIRSDVAPSTVVTDIARNHLTANRPAVVTVDVQATGGDVRTVALAAPRAGGFTLVTGPTEQHPSTPVAELDDALRMFGEALTACAPAMAA